MKEFMSVSLFQQSTTKHLEIKEEEEEEEEDEEKENVINFAYDNHNADALSP